MSLAIKYQGSLNISNGKIEILASHRKKVLTTHLYVKFKTTEKQLLDEILRGFVAEKYQHVGTNPNNKIDFAISKNNSIYMVLPETSVLTTIATLYKYIQRSKLKAMTISTKITKNQSYKKLHADIAKGFEVTITGKCRLLISKFELKLPVIDKFIASINAIEPVEMFDITAKPSTESIYSTFPVEGNDLAKLYMAIFQSEMDFTFKGNSIVASKETYAAMKRKVSEFNKSIQGNITTFLNQMGKKKLKPSANDPNGQKMKATNEESLQNLNVMIKIISDLHNIPYKPLTMSSWVLDKDALKQMKSMLK